MSSKACDIGPWVAPRDGKKHPFIGKEMPITVYAPRQFLGPDCGERLLGEEP